MKKIVPSKDGADTICSTMGCRTYNGWDINWAPAWKDALKEVAKTGKLTHAVLRSGRQKDRPRKYLSSHYPASYSSRRM